MSTTRIFFVLFTTLFAVVAAIPQSGGLGSTVTSSTLSSPAAEPSLSPCLQQCFGQALAASGCADGDHACICPSQIVVYTALTCLSANCPDQIAAAEAVQSADCAGFVDPSVLSSLDQNFSAVTGSVTANAGGSATPKASATSPSSAQGQGQQTSAGAAQPSQSSSAAKGLILVEGNRFAVVVAAVMGLIL
ncbi:hypothetical protein BDN72DRAFT_72705 [Pluteus cervinus]|uniref:Uncharacterized protein n=1 Tax=Pluteus cervinus TaxID=181527 RepID=A0ACD2ZY86_9AGAR|nr:hypothetical protein BDN72DRAFT_72705 [Pluteus cervinus]